MNLHFIKSLSILCILFSGLRSGYSQKIFSLQECLEYAIENNRNLRKAYYDKEKAIYARQEILGFLLPQINGMANLNDNLKKTKFIMPNFVNSMLPPEAQDPNAQKYMTIEMGTNYNANIGLTLNQQVLNFPLFNTLEIAKTAEKIAALGFESNEEELINQTANLFYTIQTTEYAVMQMQKSIDLVSKMLKMMEMNFENGLIKKTDVDRLRVNLVNLTTQKSSIKNAAEVEKNLLKMQMGLDVSNPIEIQSINLVVFEDKVKDSDEQPFSIKNQTLYRLFMEKLEIAKLQKKSAIYENLPVLSLICNYQYNGVSDEFFRGETNYWYPNSVIGLSLRIPVFDGLSRRSRICQNSIEEKKAKEEADILGQSLNMAYLNALLRLDDTRKTIGLQRDNQDLAEEVFNITEKNYLQGLSSMSDILNASQSLVQAQLSYANALNDYMKAYIDLKKANGSIRDLMTEK